MKYLKTFNESVTLSLGPLSNIESDKEISDEEKEELLEIFKDWVDDRSIENLDSERRMTIKRGYFIRDKYDKDSFISNTIKRTVIDFYISFGMINSDSTNVDLIRNYYEFESLEVLKERFESLGYNCQVDYFYQYGNSPSARMSVYHK
jgi:serine/threonine protein kinase HipA of HipAB toxin-antitoxin module